MTRRSSLLIGIAILLCELPVCFAQSQLQMQHAAVGTRGKPLEGRQALLNSRLHDQAQASGGKIEQIDTVEPVDLVDDISLLLASSKQVIIAHILVAYGGLNPSGDGVMSEFDALVIRPLKGHNKPGDVLRIAVPAGGLLFPDGVQASRRVKGFSNLQNGGRYVLFLHPASGELQGNGRMEITGAGVQGAFLLSEEKVLPAYHEGNLWQKYQGLAVSEFLTELGQWTAQR